MDRNDFPKLNSTTGVKPNILVRIDESDLGLEWVAWYQGWDVGHYLIDRQKAAGEAYEDEKGDLQRKSRIAILMLAADTEQTLISGDVG